MPHPPHVLGALWGLGLLPAARPELRAPQTSLSPAPREGGPDQRGLGQPWGACSDRSAGWVLLDMGWGYRQGCARQMRVL